MDTDAGRGRDEPPISANAVVELAEDAPGRKMIRLLYTLLDVDTDEFAGLVINSNFVECTPPPDNANVTHVNGTVLGISLQVGLYDPGITAVPSAIGSSNAAVTNRCVNPGGTVKTGLNGLPTKVTRVSFCEVVVKLPALTGVPAPLGVLTMELMSIPLDVYSRTCRILKVVELLKETVTVLELDATTLIDA